MLSGFFFLCLSYALALLFLTKTSLSKPRSVFSIRVLSSLGEYIFFVLYRLKIESHCNYAFIDGIHSRRVHIHNLKMLNTSFTEVKIRHGTNIVLLIILIKPGVKHISKLLRQPLGVTVTQIIPRYKIEVNNEGRPQNRSPAIALLSHFPFAPNSDELLFVVFKTTPRWLCADAAIMF